MRRAAHIVPLAAQQLSRDFATWAQAVEDALSRRPDVSIISTSDGPESAATYMGGIGGIRIDVGSSSTRLWVKQDDSSLTAGWRAIEAF